jgi:hypothetical protein
VLECGHIAVNKPGKVLAFHLIKNNSYKSNSWITVVVDVMKENEMLEDYISGEAAVYW